MQISSNIGSWMQRWNRRVNELDAKVKKTPSEVAEWGAKLAKSRAPKHTTNLAQAISWAGTKSNTATVYVRSGYNNPIGGAPATRYGAIMHRTPKSRAESIWRSGDPHFMFTVRDGAKKQLREKVNVAVGEFLGKQEL